LLPPAARGTTPARRLEEVAAISLRARDLPRRWLRQLARSWRGGARPERPDGALQAPRLAFHDLLVRSLFVPVLRPPYGKQDLYFMAVLDSFAAQLAARRRARPPASLVSLVLPVPDDHPGLRATIDSVRAQSHARWELVIVDASRSAAVAGTVASYGDPRLRRLHRPDLPDAAEARNAALDAARGELVAYVDAGDTIDADFLLVLGGELEDDGEVDMVYGAERGLERGTDGAGRPTRLRFAPFHRPTLENRNHLGLGALVHRRSLLDRHGRFDPGMGDRHDWEFILRCTSDKAARAVPALLCSRYGAVPEATGPAGPGPPARSPPDPSPPEPSPLDRAIARHPVAPAVPGVALERIGALYSLAYPVPAPRRRRPVSIVIPSFEVEPHLRACIESVRAFTGACEVELIVVDNASGPGVRAYLAGLAREGRARVVLNESNLGFSFAVNQGIGQARPGNDVVLLNNDAFVTRGWLDALQAVLDHHPDAGLVVPSQVVLAGEKSLRLHRPRAEPGRECDVNLSWHHGNVLDPLFDVARGYMELTFAPFFCTYVPRATLARVGLLDVANGPHYASDRLYCDAVRELAGRRIVYTPHAKVYHFVQRATADLKGRDRALYRDMFARNDWQAIAAREGGRGRG
jgi:GT2 family glycosyltransferase